MLLIRAWSSGAAPFVSFDDTYRDLAALTELIASADLVVLPYDSQDQVTSGVLVDAVAAGRPVVSTAFPHALELLGSGAGLVVPQRDPDALAEAIRAVLTNPELAAAMAAKARRLAPELSWHAIATDTTGYPPTCSAPINGCGHEHPSSEHLAWVLRLAGPTSAPTCQPVRRARAGGQAFVVRRGALVPARRCRGLLAAAAAPPPPNVRSAWPAREVAISRPWHTAAFVSAS